MTSYSPGYIAGFIAIRRARARQRWQTALKYLGVAAAIIFGTGTVTLVLDRDVAPATRFIVDLADCPEITPDDVPVVTFVVTLTSDLKPESYRCISWNKREAFKPKPRAKNT